MAGGVAVCSTRAIGADFMGGFGGLLRGVEVETEEFTDADCVTSRGMSLVPDSTVVARVFIGWLNPNHCWCVSTMMNPTTIPIAPTSAKNCLTWGDIAKLYFVFRNNSRVFIHNRTLDSSTYYYMI